MWNVNSDRWLHSTTFPLPPPLLFPLPLPPPSPPLPPPPPSLTGSLGRSLLGYGDVGVPGLLVALCLQFDLQQRPHKRLHLYYLVSGVGESGYEPICCHMSYVPPPPHTHTHTHCHTHTVTHTHTHTHCLTTLAYIVGLIVTFVTLVLTKRAQPALLYLVPATLGAVTFTALVRKEFHLFFTGKPRVSLKANESLDPRVQPAFHVDWV